ncbi:hypothetical protein EYC54_13900 [Xanthomonas oryzae]|nr:hypothetical protein EYC54_13900 [Xanthomonas oryzae]
MQHPLATQPIHKTENFFHKPLNYYWTAEIRCCAEYLRSLALCERGNLSGVHWIARWQAAATVQMLAVLSSEDAGV